MFENMSTKDIILWIAVMIISRYIVPKFMAGSGPKIEKELKIVEKKEDGTIETSTDFDWKTQPVTKYRPFKPVYHLTMGITKTSLKDYLRMEQSYGATIDYRTRLSDKETDETCLAAHPPDVSVKVEKDTKEAVVELYDFVLDYMSKKYPAFFVAAGKTITNMVSNKTYPRQAKYGADKLKEKPEQLLHYLCQNTEEDFLMLQYDPNIGEYVMRATTGIGTNGFRNTEKINQKLTDIHGPVPNYEKKLKLSMNRHFHRTQAGEFTQRLTWGIQVRGGLENTYIPSGIHLNENQSFEKLKPGEVDVGEEVYFRVERQILSRLPKSKFLVLTIRTYSYPLKELVAEGNAGGLATAIRAWPEDTAHYKSRPKWGDVVLGYLDEHAEKEKRAKEGNNDNNLKDIFAISKDK